MAMESDETTPLDRLRALRIALATREPAVCGDAPEWFVDDLLRYAENWIARSTINEETLREDGILVLRALGRGMLDAVYDDRCYYLLNRVHAFLDIPPTSTH
jgi:hypothetical protein